MLAKASDDNVSYLGYPVPPSMRRRLLGECWEACQPDLERTPDMQAYFESHPGRCRPFLNDGGIHISIRTYPELIALAKEMLGTRPRKDVISAAHLPSRSDQGLDNQADNTALALCAALLLMVDIRSHQYSISGSTVLDWKPDETLKNAVDRHFQSQRGVLQSENARLGKLFTARNLDLVGGLRIKWTYNLVDHLRLADDDKTVFIFHSVSFLKFHQTFGQGVFPEGFIEETLRTLSLLFPENDSKSRKWTASQIEATWKQDQQLDPGLAKCGTLRAHERRLEQFPFWHDRLVILKQAFDESSPRTLTQWWNDRRNSVQWYTFWVAIMVFVFTLFFGFVQSVEGGLQVWLAWEARNSGAS